MIWNNFWLIHLKLLLEKSLQMWKIKGQQIRKLQIFEGQKSEMQSEASSSVKVG